MELQNDEQFSLQHLTIKTNHLLLMHNSDGYGINLQISSIAFYQYNASLGINKLVITLDCNSIKLNKRKTKLEVIQNLQQVKYANLVISGGLFFIVLNKFSSSMEILEL